MNEQPQSNTITTTQNEPLGIILRILSGVTFSLMFAIIKYLGDTVPLGQVVLFRSAFALVPLIIFLLWQGGFPNGLRTKRPMGHFWRSFFGTIAMFAVFMTVRYLPIAEATTLTYLSPIILVILATTLLKETISPRRWAGVMLGLFGLLVMTTPRFSVHGDYRTLLGIGFGILGATLIAAALLQIRHLTLQGEKSATIAIYFALSTTIAGALTAVAGWVQPTAIQWFCLIGTGFLGGVAQLLMTLSLSYASASSLAPYEYLAILWAVLISMFFFNEVPTIFFWLALPLILAGAIVAKPARQ